jgi:hypothetical protein
MFWTGIWIHFIESTPNFVIFCYVYSLRLWLVKIGSIHSLNMNWNTLFLNSYIYWNGMFFLTIIYIHFLETTQNYTIFWYMYYYQLVTFLTILKITAFLVIFWNVFIHFHAEWSVKCRERRTKFLKFLKYNDNYNYPEDQYFSIHIWLKLLRAETLSQYDSSQNVRHIYKQLLSSKRISTCSIISSIWILVKFWYSI